MSEPIAVLGGGRSPEREVSLRSGHRVASALQARRYTDAPWGVGTYAPFARRGVPTVRGRADVG